MLREIIPQSLYELAGRFYENGETLYIVGGAVRNALMGLPIADIDITSACEPNRVCKLLSDYSSARLNSQSSKYGTLFINLNEPDITTNTHAGKISGQKPVEYTAFRKDTYKRGHKPEAVEFTKSLEEDALRRDFTIGAIYYDIIGGNFIDPTGGMNDIKSRTLRTVLPDPLDVLRYDGLRLMRLVRLCGQLRFSPTPKLYETAKSQAGLLDDISVERLLAELDLILLCDTAYPYMPSLLNEFSISPDEVGISPAEAVLRALYQLDDFGVWDRLLGGVPRECMELCADMPAHRILRWAALLSDNAPLARERLSWLRMDNYSKKMIISILPWLRAGKLPEEEVEKRRVIVDIGEEAATLLASIRGELGLEVSKTLNDMKQNRIPFSVNEIAIDGDALSKALGIPKSRELGDIKKKLFEYVLTRPNENTPQRLCELAAIWKEKE